MTRLVHSTFTCSRTLSLDSDLVSSFQRNFCSNFVCVSCYVHLPSLHDLYDHLDAAHNMQGPSGATTACQWPPKVPPLQAQVQCEVDDRDRSDPDQIPPLHIVYSTLPQPSVDQLSQSTLSLYEDTFNLDYFTFCDIDLVEYPLQLQPSALPPVVHQLPVFVPPDGNRTRRRRDDVDQPQPRPRGLESERVDVVDPRLADCCDIGEDSVRRIQRQPRDFNDLDSETEFDSDERESQIGPIRTLTRLRPRVDRNNTNVRSTSSSTPTVGAGILEEQVAVRPAFTSVKKKPASSSSSSESVLKKTGKAFRVGVGDIKCPVPGCIKTYKNLNGLRYHQKHGTCVIEAEATIKSLSESELAAPIHGVVSPDRAYSVQPAPLAGPPSRRPPSKSPSSSPSPPPYQLVDVPSPLPRTPVEDSSYPVNTMIPIPIPIAAPVPVPVPVPIPVPVPVPAPPPALMDYLPPPPPPPRILLRGGVHSTSLSSCFILL